MPVRRALAPATSGALVALAAASVVAAPGRYAWEDEDTERGIRLQVSNVPDHGYDAVKASATLDAPPETLVAALRDFARYPSWYHGCKQTRVLESTAEPAPVALDARGRFLPLARPEVYKLLFVQSVPVLEDRWAVITNRLRVTRRGALAIEFRSIDRARHPHPAGAVRMRVRGQWLLEPLGRQRTKVTFIIDIDPDTSTPAFMVDPHIHAVALGTLDGLRRVARSARSERGRTVAVGGQSQ